MVNQLQSHRTYTNHRESQRERILEVAEKLFLRDGIDGVPMRLIASGARLTRVTLYEYFPDKKEIAWAIFQKVIEEFHSLMDEKIALTSGSGYAKIERYLNGGIEALESQPEHLRFIALFNFLYAREGGPMRMRNILDQAAGSGALGSVDDWIREGIADGSLRSDLDVGLVSAAIRNLIAGLTSRFALLGTNVEQEFGYPVNLIFREIYIIFLRGIRLN